MPNIQVFEATASIVASMLLQIEAIKLSVEKPFTWSSGWKSPIYCDNRLSLSYPAIRTQVKKGLVQVIQQQFSACEAIAGVATAGIPQGALVADSLNLPFVYVRSKPKGHGMENLIEGKVTPGQKIAVIEDLVSTGGSSLKAAHALRQSGFEVIGMAAIFNYGFDEAEKNFHEAGIPLFSLSDYSHLIKMALENNHISQADFESLSSWRTNPATWTPA